MSSPGDLTAEVADDVDWGRNEIQAAGSTFIGEEHDPEAHEVMAQPKLHYGRPPVNLQRPIVERHCDFCFTMPPATSRLAIRRHRPGCDEDFSGLTGGSSSLRSVPEASSAHPATARATVTGNGIDSVICSSTSNLSTQSRRSCGVPVRPWMLPRQDTVPDRNSGKRSICAPDRRIRIFIRIAGKGGRIALWVHPDIPIGPPPPGPRNRFTDIWGESADGGGPCVGRAESADGRLTPFRKLLAERDEQRQRELQELDEEAGGDVDDFQVAGLPSEECTSSLQFGGASTSFAVGSTFATETHAEGSLKELLEAITGVSVPRQKLTCGRVGRLDDHRRVLCEYDIGHGALLFLSVQPEKGQKSHQRFLASPARAQEQVSAFSFNIVNNFVSNKVGPKKGSGLVESLPDWRDSVTKPAPPLVESPQEPYYRTFINAMHGKRMYDTSDTIRGRFPQTQRAATAHSASKRLLPMLAAQERASSSTYPLTAR
mmetsp:Transcript_7303/g.18257  ORF Transcript_7303/g.18257 Transcript_7303/m.18257 type:complete len:486 (-) Transcript_7303:283-1740(-)